MLEGSLEVVVISSISTFGYSGDGKHRNDPTAQCLKNQGPAPANTYTLNTYGNDQDKIYGRTEIMIHKCACCTTSDWRVQPIDGCSVGCIIINKENRKKLRIGDTLFVQDYDPVSIKMTSLQIKK